MILAQYDMTKIYTASIMSILSNIKLKRENSLWTVPVYFGTRDRLFQQQQEEARKSSTSTLYEIQLPAFSVELTDVQRNLSRQTNRLVKKKVDITGINTVLTWNDTSVDLTYKVILRAKSILEMTEINEGLLSAFKNGVYYIKIKTPLYDDPISTPIVFDTISVELNNNETEFLDNRVLTSIYSMKIKGIYHHNVTTNSKEITEINFNLWYKELYDTLLKSYVLIP
jgi:hypothetical protein